MNNSAKEQGMLMAVLDRLNNYRLPRALWLKDKVNRGEKLDSSDQVFLERWLAESEHTRRLVAKRPEYEPLVAQLASLYSDIVCKGLENEKKGLKVTR